MPSFKLKKIKKGHKCRVLPRCTCLLPELGPFHVCCGYYCLKCNCNLNHRYKNGVVK